MLSILAADSFSAPDPKRLAPVNVSGHNNASEKQPERNMNADGFSPWRVGRNTKMFFCPVCDTPEGKEFRRDANGNQSSYKSRDAAERVCRAMNRAEGS